MNAPVTEPPAAAAAPGRVARAGSFVGAQVRQAGRTPVTLSLVVVIWLLGAVTGSLVDGPSADFDAGDDLLATVGAGVQNLTNGHVWTFVTAAFFASDLWTYIGSTVLLLVAGVAFERRHGSVRTAWIALVVQFVGAGLAVCAIWLAAQLDWTWAQDLADQFAIGPSMLVAGLVMAFSGGCTALWRRRIRLTVLTICVVMVLYGGMALDVLRLTEALIGLAVGVLLLHTGERHLTARSSRRETRVLVALVVAATALGPILVAVTGGGNVDAPFAAVGLLYIGPDVADGDPIGVADTIMALVPALLVLVIAAGLRRGRAFAWWAGIIMHVLLVLIGAVFMVAYFQSLSDLGDDLVDDGFNYVTYLLPVVLVPLVILLLLVLSRRVFTISAPAGTYRRLGVIVLGTFLGLWILYVVVGVALSSDFVIGDPPSGGAPTIGNFVLDFPLQLLPNGYDYVIGPDINPVGGGVARFVADWAPVTFWLVVLVGMLRTFVTADVTGPDADRERAREILRRHGITTLAYMTTWHGNSYWFSADGESYVAYRVEGGVAITTGDPVGPAGQLERTVDEFVDYCNDRRLDALPVQHHQATKRATDRLGWPSLQVAEETVLPLGSLAFSGKKFQDIRSSISRAAKSRHHRGVDRFPGRPAVHPGPDRGDLRGVGLGQGAARDGLHPRRHRRTQRHERALPDRGRRRSDRARGDQLDAVLPGRRAGRLDPGLHAPAQRRRRQGDHGVPHRHRRPGRADRGRRVPVDVRRAAGPGQSGRRAGRRAEDAGVHRPDDGAGLRLPVAAQVQGQVPAGLRTDVHVLSGDGGAAADRYRHLPRLPAAPDRGPDRADGRPAALTGTVVQPPALAIAASSSSRVIVERPGRSSSCARR